MIPVQVQPEPQKFDELVRQPGLKYLASHPNVARSKIPPLWQNMNQELWISYHGICAYLAIFFEFASGASSTDHFAPKSKNKQDAYEWGNYRLACLAANRKKNSHLVLDPFTIKDNSFEINFFDGEIQPNPHMDLQYQEQCKKTIDLLDLNSPINKEMRARHYEDYCKGYVSLHFLKTHSPFVWAEVIRQGLQ